MRLGLFGLATVAAVALSAGTASAQYHYYYGPGYRPYYAPRVVVAAPLVYAPPVVAAPGPVVVAPAVATEVAVGPAGVGFGIGTPAVSLGVGFGPVFRPAYVPYRPYYPYYHRHW